MVQKEDSKINVYRVRCNIIVYYWFCCYRLLEKRSYYLQITIMTRYVLYGNGDYKTQFTQKTEKAALIIDMKEILGDH